MAGGAPVRMVSGMAVTTPSTHGARPPRRRGRRDGADGQVLGALLVLGGVGWFLQQVGLVHLSLTTTLSALLIVLGVGLVLTARRAGGAGLVVIGLLLTVVLASASAVDGRLLQRGVGERTYTPTAGDSLRDGYQLGVGSLTLDLSEIAPEDLAGERVRVQVGVGELVVLLPPRSDVAVDVRATARAGELDVLDAGSSSDDGGTNLVDTFRDRDVPDGTGVLELDLEVGLGTVQVVRPPSR